MTASYPAAIKAFSDQTDNVSTIDAADINEAYDEIEAIETALGINRFSTEAAGSVFNEGSADYDFRFEGNGDTELLYLDAGNDRVGISTSTPPATFSVAGQRNYDTYVQKAVIVKTGITDNSATGCFTITCADATADGGAFTCFVKAAIIHGGVSNNDNSVIGGCYHFSRGMDQDGAGSNSAVVEAGETAVGASDAAARTQSTTTMSVTETSEFVQTVNFLVDVSGTAATTAVAVLEVTLIWYGFVTAPVIAAV